MKRAVLVGLVVLLVLPAVLIGAAVGAFSLGGGAGAGLGPVGLREVPEPYRTLVQEFAPACPGLSPAVMAAQLAQESGFDARAVSGQGAEGPAQFLPATWAAYGSDGSHPPDGVADPFEPADAVASQAGYLCVLRQAVAGVGGDPLANLLAAYNAGPAAVTHAGGIPPITETQTYVVAILARAERWAAPQPLA